MKVQEEGMEVEEEVVFLSIFIFSMGSFKRSNETKVWILLTASPC